jgi:Lon protease-like protein
MSDVTFETPEPEEHQLEFPAALPVLPLKETVVFPQSMTPLAIGQERSVRLIDDVVAGDRLLAMPRSSRRRGTTSTTSAPSRSCTR